jgi:hypothetical protein
VTRILVVDDASRAWATASGPERHRNGKTTSIFDGHTVAMKLAEGLALRVDAARRAERLRARIAASARYQEGEEPAEDAAALLAEAGEVLGELESLIRRINRTNSATAVEGGTLTDALARRDILRLRHSVVTSAADAASGDGQRAFRQLRSELKMIPALPIAELRSQADGLAQQLREVDTLIQRTNWEADLLD